MRPTAARSPLLAAALLLAAACAGPAPRPPIAAFPAAEIPKPEPAVPLPFDPVLGPAERRAAPPSIGWSDGGPRGRDRDPWERDRWERDRWERDRWEWQRRGWSGRDRWDPWDRDPWGRRHGFGPPPAWRGGADPFGGWGGRRGRGWWEGNGQCDDGSYNTSNGGRAPSGADEQDCRRLGLGDGRKRPYVGRMLDRWF